MAAVLDADIWNSSRVNAFQGFPINGNLVEEHLISEIADDRLYSLNICFCVGAVLGAGDSKMKNTWSSFFWDIFVWVVEGDREGEEEVHYTYFHTLALPQVATSVGNQDSFFVHQSYYPEGPVLIGKNKNEGIGRG